MNRLKDKVVMQRVSLGQSVPLVVLCALCCLLGGCGDAIRLPSEAQLIDFEDAGPNGPAVDTARMVQVQLDSGPYRVVIGDVLQLELPRILDPYATSGAVAESNQTHTCRVGDTGEVVLPVVGRVKVAGMTLAEIESRIAAEYHPRYFKTLPPVYASVLEYNTKRVSVVGAVVRPGVYALRHDQMSLVALLMEAGGIADEGAAMIRITRSRHNDGPRDSGSISPLSHRQRENDAGGWRKAVSESMLGPDRFGRSGSTGAAHLAFERDGPLYSTGWLVVEEHGEVVLRRWLDLASESQRQTLLAAWASKSELLARAEVDAALIRLARLLRDDREELGAALAAKSTEWQLRGQGRFVAPVHERAPEQNRHYAVTRVSSAGPSYEDDGTTLVLPIRGLNIPFADVPLQAGDSVVVEPPQEKYVAVLGLVNRPGNFLYPPTAQYTLAQAVALAGGLDLIADPRYVGVYRLRTDGTVASATYQLVNPKNQEQLTQAMALPLKPGDVVDVRHTPRTRNNVFFDRIFRVSLGLYLRPEELWGGAD